MQISSFNDSSRKEAIMNHHNQTGSSPGSDDDRNKKHIIILGLKIFASILFVSIIFLSIRLFNKNFSQDLSHSLSSSVSASQIASNISEATAIINDTSTTEISTREFPSESIPDNTTVEILSDDLLRDLHDTRAVNTRSSDYNSERKYDCLRKYMELSSRVLDLSYHIIYEEDFDIRLPDPYGWDIRVALKIQPEDCFLWTKGFQEISTETVNWDWWEDLKTVNITWDRESGKTYQDTENFNSYLVVFEDSGIILKYISYLEFTFEVMDIFEEKKMKIHPDLPDFVFRTVGIIDEAKDRLIGETLIILNEETGKVMSTFHVSLYRKMGRNLSDEFDDDEYNDKKISFLDMNFDGYEDFYIRDTSVGTGFNTYYFYFLWDQINIRFIHERALDNLYACSFNAEKKEIYSSDRSGAAEHWTRTHQFIDGALTTTEEIHDKAFLFTSEQVTVVFPEFEGSELHILWRRVSKLNFDTMEREIEEIYQMEDNDEEYSCDSEIGKKIAELILKNKA